MGCVVVLLGAVFGGLAGAVLAEVTDPRALPAFAVGGVFLGAGVALLLLTRRRAGDD